MAFLCRHVYTSYTPYLCTSLLYFVLRVRCRCEESSRSLSHLLMSFLYFRRSVGVQVWLFIFCTNNYRYPIR